VVKVAAVKAEAAVIRSALPLSVARHSDLLFKPLRLIVYFDFTLVCTLFPNED
jgi:hypothetical protein